MGLLNTVKDTVLGSDEEDDLDDVDLGGGINDDEEMGHEEGSEFPEAGGEEEEIEQEQEEEVMEWESAYKFAEWALESYGFANMSDFGRKAMYHEIRDSPLFRDRIQSGLNTVSNLRQAKEEVDRIAGRNKDDMDMEKLAKDMENANKVISNIKSMEGQEEMMVQQGMDLAKQALSGIADRKGTANANVQSDVQQSNEEI